MLQEIPTFFSGIQVILPCYGMQLRVQGFVTRSIVRYLKAITGGE